MDSPDVQCSMTDESDGCQKMQILARKTNSVSRSKLKKYVFDELKELTRTCERTRIFEIVFMSP